VKTPLVAALTLSFLAPFSAPAEAQFIGWPSSTPAPTKPAARPPAHAAAKPAPKPAAPAKPSKAAKAAPPKAEAKSRDKSEKEAKSAAKPDTKAPATGKSAASGKPAADALKPAAAAAAATGAVATAAVAATPPKPLDRAEAIKRAEASLNASPVLTADFVQIGGDGRRAEGKLFIHKVGRMRFEYAQPATMEVVSDGITVAVRDRKLNTQDLYFIAQTPLKFLLNEKIDLEKDVKLLDVVTDDAGTAITIEDKATLGGTSRIKLIFDGKTFQLKQWQVSDPQGYETLVSLFNIDRDSAPDPKLFKIAKE
jgi:outer membrane lipoprotein-sorting protein